MKPVIPFAQVTERLKRVLNVENDGALADILGIRRNAFYNRKASDSLPYEHIFCVCRDRGVSLDWVFSGVGAPLLDSAIMVQPVAEVQPELFARIALELWTAFDGKLARETSETVAERAGLAAQIFNRTVFVRPLGAQSSAIKAEAVALAAVARWMKESKSLS